MHPTTRTLFPPGFPWAPVRALLVAVLLLTAGCLGDRAPAPTGPEPEVTDAGNAPNASEPAPPPTGPARIVGSVADTAARPVRNASVTLLEENLTVTTARDGHFAIGLLAPGNYTLLVEAAGFVPGLSGVGVGPGETTSVEFQLAPLPAPRPYVEQWELAGLLRTGHAVGSDTTGPLAAGRDCEASSGEGCSFEVLVDPPVADVVIELAWEASDPLARSLALGLALRASPGNDAASVPLTSLAGPSPLVLRLDRSTLAAAGSALAERCAGGEDSACGATLETQGWPLALDVGPHHGCLLPEGGACLYVNQGFTVFVTAFHVEPGPAGFRVG